MISIKQKHLKIYIILATLSLFVTLWVPYIGEEAVYTISSYEMWYHHSYLINTLYGNFYGRPPLLNWLIIPLSHWIGWQHVLIVSRFISATSTALVVFGLWWFVRRLTKNSHFALLCAAIYLTGDLIYIRGWLAYADPLLSFFIFFSIIFLWLGVEEERYVFLILGLLSLSAGFLVKAISPYWFYGLSGLVLLVFHPNRKFLLRPISFNLHLFALLFPFVWNYYSSPLYLPAMWSEAVNTAFSPTFMKYLFQVLIVQPTLLLLRLAPISLVAVYYYFKQVKHKPVVAYRQVIVIAFWIAFLNFAVCWFAPRWTEARYYMPVFPFMAMCLAYVVWNADRNAHRLTAFLLALMLLEKALFIGYFYYRYEYREPNYQAEAKDILKITGNKPIIVDRRTRASAPVETVAFYIDINRFPQPPLITPHHVAQKVNLSYNHDTVKQCRGTYYIGQMVTLQDSIMKQYAAGKRRVYLLCHQKK